MLFDSDVNVYGDSHVYIPEFDFKNRVVKNNAAFQKGKKFQKTNLQREKQLRMRQNYKYGQQKNIKDLQEAPETIKNRAELGYNIGLGATDSIGYTPNIASAPTYNFKNNIEMAGPVADLMEFDTKNKEIDQRKRDRMANQTLSQTSNQLNESMYSGQQQLQSSNTQRNTNTNDQSMMSDVELVPAAKRAQDKAEYERRKQEELEIKRQIEEER